jgi:hypothetical protein
MAAKMSVYFCHRLAAGAANYELTSTDKHLRLCGCALLCSAGALTHIVRSR